MRIGYAVEARNQFIDAWVVFHRAGPQGVHAEINRIIPGGKAREVADDFDLAHLGHIAQIASLCRT